MDCVVGGKFNLGKKIVSGSFGELYLGVNLQTGEECVVKLTCRFIWSGICSGIWVMPVISMEIRHVKECFSLIVHAFILLLNPKPISAKKPFSEIVESYIDLSFP